MVSILISATCLIRQLLEALLTFSRNLIPDLSDLTVAVVVTSITVTITQGTTVSSIMFINKDKSNLFSLKKLVETNTNFIESSFIILEKLKENGLIK